MNKRVIRTGIIRTKIKEIEGSLNLVKNEILSEEMRKKLKGMKGFRNIVVHRYGAIDDRLAFDLYLVHLTLFTFEVRRSTCKIDM